MNLSKALKNLSEIHVLLVSSSPAKYQETTNEFLRFIARSKGYWIYVTINKPFATVRSRFLKNKVDLSGIFFIDMAASPSAGVKRDANCLYLGSPHDLTSVSIAIDEAVYSMRENKFVLFDTINTLLNYNSEATIIRFLHSLAGKMRMRNAKLILLSVGSQNESIISQLSQFCDKYIILGDGKNV